VAARGLPVDAGRVHAGGTHEGIRQGAVLTPPSTLRVLEAGYRPWVHPSVMILRCSAVWPTVRITLQLAVWLQIACEDRHEKRQRTMRNILAQIFTLSSLSGVLVGPSVASAATPDEATCFLTAGTLVMMETKGQLLYDPGAGHKVVTAIWESYRALISPEEQRICVSRADNYPDNLRVLEYIRRHPETQKRCAPEVVVGALTQLYPCGQDVREQQVSANWTLLRRHCPSALKCTRRRFLARRFMMLLSPMAMTESSLWLTSQVWLMASGGRTS
jgi:hypothetical protein